MDRRCHAHLSLDSLSTRAHGGTCPSGSNANGSYSLANVIHPLSERSPLRAAALKDRCVVVVPVYRGVELKEWVCNRLSVCRMQGAENLGTSAQVQ